LPRPRYNAKTAVHELQMLLDDQSYSDHATEVGKVVSQEQGACVAADEIEKVLKAS
jgi:UDP:flavonoid glycosyltransferase YjiC (YdhE family)